MEELTPPPPNHALKSSVVSHAQTISQQHNTKQPTNFPWKKRQDESKGDVNEPQVVPSQPSTSRASTKASNASFSVVDKMRKKNVKISMWDFVATIPSQMKLLQ